jgi:hypothetical protein
MSQTGSTAIYSGDTSAFKYWSGNTGEPPGVAGDGFVFGTQVGVPPLGTPSGNAVLIQSATTNWTVGLPVYISAEINVGVTPTPTETSTNTPTPSVTNTQTPTNTETPTPTETEVLTPTPTETETPTPTPTNTETPTETPTNTPTPTSGATPVGTWFFYSPDNVPAPPPEDNGDALFTYGTAPAIGTYNPNYTGGTFNIYFNNNSSEPISYLSQFSGLNTTGGTITISQGGNVVIYSGTSGNYNAGPNWINLNVTGSTQMIQSASTSFVSGSTINVVVS